MKIEHLAIWVDEIEVMRKFYTTYFNAKSNKKYNNPTKKYESYFLSFGENDGSRIELMTRPDILKNENKRGFTKGLAHFAIQLENKETVDKLTERLRVEGFIIASEPRTTGDGYYESAVLDPEGNYVEITT